MPNIDADPIHIDRRIQKINAKKEEIFAVDSPYATKDYVDQKAGTSGGGGGGGSSSGATGIGSSIRDAIDWSVIKRTNKFYQVDNGLVICYAIDAGKIKSSKSTVYKSWVFYPNRDESGFVSCGFRCFYSVDADPTRAIQTGSGNGWMTPEGIDLYKELYGDQLVAKYADKDLGTDVYPFGLDLEYGIMYLNADKVKAITTRKQYCGVINSPVAMYSEITIDPSYKDEWATIQSEVLNLSCSFPSFSPLLYSLKYYMPQTVPNCLYTDTLPLPNYASNDYLYVLACAGFFEQDFCQTIDSNATPQTPFQNAISVYNMLGTDTTNAALIPDAVKENTYLLEWS